MDVKYVDVTIPKQDETESIAQFRVGKTIIEKIEIILWELYS